jgi:hypothetical protein
MPSDFERADLMARQAYLLGTFGESEDDFARRIAEIGATRGVRAAAEAISEECNANGIRMSPRRALKSLAQTEQHLRGKQQRPPPPARTGPGPDYSPASEYLDEMHPPERRVNRGFALAAIAVMAAMDALSMILR